MYKPYFEILPFINKPHPLASSFVYIEAKVAEKK